MNKPLVIEGTIVFDRSRGGRRRTVREHEEVLIPQGRVPRIARLMALAIRFEQLIQQGHIASYAELARLSHVTRARITQIMNLRMLSPDIQEAILFLPRIQSGRDPITISDLQTIALVPDWRKQRRIWKNLLGLK